MHIKSVLASLALVALTGCGGNQPAPPPAASAQPTAQPAPAADDVLAPLFGTWALDLSQCSGTEVLKISNARFDGPTGSCDITSFTDNGDGTYTAAMSCAGNGQTSNESIMMRPIFAPTGEGIDLVYLNRDSLASTVLRCPAPKP